MNKIDLIIEALLVAESSVWSDKIAEALVAALELKAMKPVAWIKRPEKVGYKSVKLTFDPQEDDVSTPLYALDEVTK